MGPSIKVQKPGNIHEQIQVVEYGNKRYLRFGSNGGWQGAYHTTHPNRILFPYQRAFAATISCLSNVNRYISVGVGTGTSLRTVLHQFSTAELYGVEIDERVVDLAVAYFGSPSHQQTNYWIGDGVAFLCNVDLTFDLVFVDAYMPNDVYAPTVAPGFAHVLKAALNPFGTAVMNVICRSWSRGAVGRFVDEAKTCFSVVGALPVGVPGTDQNMLILMTNDESVRTMWPNALKQAHALHPFERWCLPFRLRFI